MARCLAIPSRDSAPFNISQVQRSNAQCVERRELADPNWRLVRPSFCC